MRGTLEVSVTGTQQLAELAARLKTEGRNDLRKELLAGLRNAAKPAQAAVAQSARETLPKRGGYADVIATEISTPSRSYLGHNTATVRVYAHDDDRPQRALKSLNEGKLRHPVFGRRADPWKEQAVAPGFFTRPLLALRGRAQLEIAAVVASIARRLAS